jgi:Family of unknown function (DUF6491)
MTRIDRLRRSSLALAPVLWLAFGSPAFAQDGQDAESADAFDRTPEDCVSTPNIDRTHAVDDRTILFFMRGKKVYRNYLPRKCPNLERQNRIMYKTHGARLCDVDTITVLEQWGARLTPGFTCPLGEFHPITPEEVEDLMRKPEDVRDAIEGEAVESPEDDDAAQAPEDEQPAEAPAASEAAE